MRSGGDSHAPTHPPQGQRWSQRRASSASRTTPHPCSSTPTASAVGVTRHGAGEAAAQRPPAHCMRAPAPRAKETGKVTERIGENPGETKLAGLWVLKVVLCDPTT
jgi:hypothetical protein